MSFAAGTGPETVPKAKKRQQLQDIQAREELKAARNRLRSILYQKLCNRFKKAKRNDISRLVDEMLTNRVKITATELANLEEACRILDKAAIAAAKDAASNRNKNSVTFSNSGPEPQDKTREGADDNIPISRVIQGHEWQMLMMYDIEEGAEKERRMLAEKKKRELEARKILDEQIAEKKRLAQLERDQEKSYLDTLIRNLDQAQAEKDELARRLKEKNELQNDLWNKHLAEERARKQAAKDEQIRLEQEAYAEVQRQLKEEQERIRKKKEEEGIKNQMLMDANEKDRLYRLELKQKEIEADNLMNLQYQAKLDKEAKDRDEAFKKRMEKLAQYAEQVDNGPIMRAKREEEARLDKIRQREQQARFEALRTREVTEAANRREARLKMQRENQAQIDAKKKQEEAAKISDAVIAEKFFEDAKEAARLERERKRLEHEARLKYGTTLLRQMALDRSHKNSIDDMIERERRYNSKNLKNIVDDTKVYDKICGKLRLSLSQKLKTTVAMSKTSRDV